MKTCPACQQTYSDDVESCPRDGSRLETEAREERECPYCAERILSKARVCKHCGREVEPLAGTGIAAPVPSSAPSQRIPGPPTAQAQASRASATAGRRPGAAKSSWHRTRNRTVALAAGVLAVAVFALGLKYHVRLEKRIPDAVLRHLPDFVLRHLPPTDEQEGELRRLTGYLTPEEAEAQRRQQEEEKARRIHELLGDELASQVGYVGIVDADATQALANNPSLARTWGLDRANGYQIQDLKMYINRTNGTLTVIFGCQFNNGASTLSRMLVRLFDANGEHITHFVTREYFAAPNCRYLTSRPDSCRGGIPLKRDSNVLQYSVNLRDAAYVQRAEFGLYTGQ